MFRITFVFLFVITTLLGISLSLVELPNVEENDIFKAEAAIRETANLLFSKLKIKEKYFKSPIKQYFIAHNYFIGITLQDYVNLKKIARLTRVDNNDEVTAYMDILNEILNESTDNADKEILHDENVLNTIQSLVNELTYVTGKNNTQAKEFRSEIWPQILQHDNNWAGENEIRNLLDDYDEGSNETSLDSEVWVPEPATRRIFKGRMTKVKRFPYMAVVLLFNQFTCAGSIIAKDLILTAASCVQLAWNNRFFRENPAFLSVRVGSTFYSAGGEVINVQEVYFYPTYNPKNLKDNICVLRLIRHLRLKNARRVQIIHFDRSASPLPVTTDDITIVGWGATDSSNLIKGPWVNRLSYSVLDFYPHHDCKDIYSKEYVGPKTFCAGFISKGSGACNRDVGGPGIVDDILVGIISFGSAICGVPDYPTVFTKVGFYADWIEDIIELEVPTKKSRTTMSTTYSYTLGVNMETTTLVMTPIGDPGLVYVDTEQQEEVLRNRIPEDDAENVSSESTEISIFNNDTNLDKLPTLTTSIITDTVSPEPEFSSDRSSEKSSQMRSTEETTTKKTKKIRKKKIARLKPQYEMSLKDISFEDLEKLSEKELEEKNKRNQYEIEYGENAREELMSIKTTKSAKKEKKIKKKKRLRIGQIKKMRKVLTRTTKMPSLRKKTTPKAEKLFHYEERPITTTKTPNKYRITVNDNYDPVLTTLPDNNINPLDSLSQKEFYALLAEVLDKLERDLTKETTV